jgi:hypothetical protein
LLPLLVILLWAPAPRALAAEPEVGELVENAVEALRTTCYEARMSYFASNASGEEQTVHIYHVAPDLYHVETLKRDEHGQWTPQGFYFIENADELLRVQLNRDNEVLLVEELPERSFYLNATLAGKFLRDLARHPGTVVLDGVVDGLEVYQLRQLAFPEKPYTITVGLDKRNYFPVFLLVNDSDQQPRIYYKMEAIEYCSRDRLDVALFRRPQISAGQMRTAPRVEQLAPNAAVLNPAAEDEDGEARLQIQRSAPSKTAAEALAEPLDYALPPYPEYLPAGYYLEGLHLLDYKAVDSGAPEPILVYHFEVFSPVEGITLSIFLTQSDDFGFDMDQGYNMSSRGYIVQQQGDWLVAVFGDAPSGMLLDVAGGLEPDTERIEKLLTLTQARDNVLQTLNVSD